LLFLSGIWWIWRRGNILAFREEYLGDNWLLRQIYFLKNMYCDAKNNSNMVRRHPIIVSWLRPEEKFIKLDVGCSSLRNPGRIGFGGSLKKF
jgi:hypothetical protein